MGTSGVWDNSEIQGGARRVASPASMGRRKAGRKVPDWKNKVFHVFALNVYWIKHQKRIEITGGIEVTSALGTAIIATVTSVVSNQGMTAPRAASLNRPNMVSVGTIVFLSLIHI